MRIIVTGAAGFIGSHVADMLLARKHRVLGIDNFSTGKSENVTGFCALGGALQDADITDMKAISGIVRQFQPEVIVHLAAQSAITTSFQDPQRDCQQNVLGTLNLLTLCRQSPIKMVFSSTSAVYRESHWRASESSQCEPVTPYGISKLACEQYIRCLLPNKHVILRYGNVYGPRQVPVGQNQVIARAFRHFLFGDDFYVTGDGKQRRDFVYVLDVAYANLMSVTEDVSGTFNVCTGKSYSVNHVLSLLEKMYDVPGYKWQHTDKPDPRGDAWMVPTHIRTTLGWIATTKLEQGLKDTKDWWEKQK